MPNDSLVTIMSDADIVTARQFGRIGIVEHFRIDATGDEEQTTR